MNCSRSRRVPFCRDSDHIDGRRQYFLILASRGGWETCRGADPVPLGLGHPRLASYPVGRAVLYVSPRGSSRETFSTQVRSISRALSCGMGVFTTHIIRISSTYIIYLIIYLARERCVNWPKTYGIVACLVCLRGRYYIVVVLQTHEYRKVISINRLTTYQGAELAAKEVDVSVRQFVGYT